jgi:hypothetical protein
MNFVLSGMSFLRYFLPLIIEGNKSSLKSRVFWAKTVKYDSPDKAMLYLDNMSKQYDFELYPVDRIDDYPDITFFVEGSGWWFVHRAKKMVSLVSMRDFTAHYDGYINSVNHVVFCSKFFSEYYGKKSPKNLYFGSPKYDVKFDKNEVLEKYGIPHDKKISLVVFPLQEHLQKINLTKIYGHLRDLGYVVIVKTRGKNKTPNNLRGDKYFEDFSWFPHTTMELIYASDLVINFTSGTIKECLMLDRPVINFNIYKPESEQISFLYNNSCCLGVDLNINTKDFKVKSEFFLSKDLKMDFYNVREKYLFQPNQNSSKKILDFVL